MRLLCLHGVATNSQIFEAQTAAIRHELGSEHTFDFIDGDMETPMHPGIAGLLPPGTPCFAWLDPTSARASLHTVDDLESFTISEGPYDGLFCFSQGAGLAASLLIRLALTSPSPPLFKCAIFFSGAVPGDARAAAEGVVRYHDPAVEGAVIEVPTAHVWGNNDQEHPTYGPVLAKLCKEETRAVFVHEGGHEVPGARDRRGVEGAVEVIRKTMERAMSTQ